MNELNQMEVNELEAVKKAVDVLDAKKAEDIRVIDIGEKSSFADYFVLCSGRNERQIGGLADAAEEALSKEGMTPRSIEGTASSGWILMDYGDIIINILTESMREKYSIEQVWADCETILQAGNDEV